MRSRVELVARAALLALLAFMAWRSFLPENVRDPERSPAASLNSDLRRWVRSAPPSIEVDLRPLPNATQRAWMQALALSGTTTHWSGASDAAMVVSSEPLAQPGNKDRLSVGASANRALMVSDAAGFIDSLPTKTTAATLLVPSSWGSLHVTAGADSASTTTSDSLQLRPILVLGRAGWESKFVLAALEEAGWKTETRIHLRPDAVVRQGDAPVDTAHFSAVVALDSSSLSRADQIARFVRSGGGLIVAPEAATLGALFDLLPSPVRAESQAIAAREPAATRASLSLHPLQISVNAISVERRNAVTAVAARRVGAGRVIQIGYDDTWRWRMSASIGAQDHREWWSSLVASVARAPLAPRELDSSTPLNDAPFARTVASLGPPSGTSSASSTVPAASNAWIAAFFFMLLLGELASRRLRGVR